MIQLLEFKSSNVTQIKTISDLGGENNRLLLENTNIKNRLENTNPENCKVQRDLESRVLKILSVEIHFVPKNI